MARKRMFVCVLALLVLSLTVTASSPAELGVASLTSGEVNWEYAYKFSDPEGDTQGWSKSMDYLPSRPGLEPPMLRYGNTSEYDNDTGWWKPNAPYDDERDITAFWITWDMERVYMRIFVRDLRDNYTVDQGAIYLIAFDYWPLGQHEAQLNARTYSRYTDNGSTSLWERNIAIEIEQGYDEQHAWMKSPDWGTPSETWPMEVYFNFTGNYVDASALWDAFKIGPFLPTYFNITLMSIKPGEWDGGLVGSFRRCFDPQDPGTLGAEWIPPGLSAGPDAADVMPGDASEIDWTWNNATVDLVGGIVPENSISSWYHVPISWKFMAHHAYEYLGTHDVYVWSNRSTVMMETFDLDEDTQTISFNVTGLSGDTGGCNVTIPKTFMIGPGTEDWIVLLNGAVVTPEITENATHTFIGLNYTFDSVPLSINIGGQIVPEFSVVFIPVLLVILTATLIIFGLRTGKTKRFKSKPFRA